MKKFSKINESRITDMFTMSVEIKLDKSTCNDILEHILRVYPNDKVLRAYGYDKAIHKYVSNYISHYEMDIDKNIKENIQIDIENYNEEIEQLFLDDLSVDETVMDDIINKFNTDDIK